MKKYILTSLLLSALLPNLIFAADVKLDYSGLVKCDGVLTKGEADRQVKCDFAALLQTIKSGINWLFVITIPIMVVLLAYGGLLYMTGSQKNISTAKAIFLSVVKGFIIMLIAWVSVVTVVNWFISDTNKAVINTFVNTGK